LKRKEYNLEMAATLLRFCSFWMYPSTAAILLVAANRAEPEPSPVALLWLVPTGVLLWSLLEYGLHRLVFHWNSRIPTVRKIVRQFHLFHHAEPRRKDQILVRARFSVPMSIAILASLHAITDSPFQTIGIMAGIWTGFLYYEWVHYNVHTSSANLGLAAHRRRHFIHHFIDDKSCYGVTSPLWDRLLGTYRKV
jgi:4-hydroxysphinganine ceramide fatty acyl 2-hydroxylase